MTTQGEARQNFMNTKCGYIRVGLSLRPSLVTRIAISGGYEHNAGTLDSGPIPEWQPSKKSWKQ